MPAALLSSAFRGILSAEVAAAEMHEGGDAALLYPEEAVTIARAAPKRIADFAAGRLCARRALAEFGIVDFPVRAASDRQPVWPETMVGSITHTEGLCVAAVAERRRFSSIGIDCERIAPMEAGVCDRICVPAESEWIASLPADQQMAAALLIFSAKEAFFKCQYPLVGEWLNFRDLCIEAPQWRAIDAGSASYQAVDAPINHDAADMGAAPFVVRATRPIALAHRVSMPLQGRYRVHQGFVSAGMALPAASLIRM